MVFEGIGMTSRFAAYEYYRSVQKYDYTLAESLGVSFGIGALVQGVLLPRWFAKSVLNHAEDSLALSRKEFKSNARTSLIETHPLIWLRGGILGVISLTFYDQFVNFLEENRENLVRK